MNKSFFRKFLACFVSFLLSLSSTPLYSTVHAADSGKLTMTRLHINFGTGKSSSWHEGYMTLKGKQVFCADYSTAVGNNATYTADASAFSKYSGDVIKKIKTASYYGYGYNGDTSKTMYMATQIVLWEIIEGKSFWVSQYDPSKHSKEENNKKGSEIISASETQAKMDVLRNQVNTHYEHFEDKPTIEGTYSLDGVGNHHVMTLTDTSGQLEEYDLSDASGLDVNKNGNTLTISSNEVFTGNKDITLSFGKRNSVAGINTNPLIYKKSGKQDVISLAYPVAASVTLHVNMPTGHIKLTKKDKDTSDLISEPATFELYDEYGNKADTLHTVNGEATSSLLAQGHYTLKETGAPNGYKASADIGIDTSFTDEETCHVIVNDEKITGSIHLDKSIVLDKSVDVSKIDTSDLSKIEFSLYASDDIKDPKDNHVVYKKDQLIHTYNLSKKGTLDISSLLLGDYYLKETKTLSNLRFNNTKYEVHLSQSDPSQTLTGTIHAENRPVYVEFSKKSITGSDELEGAHLEIYDSHNNLVDHWVSTKKTHKIEGLNIGEVYTLKETAAPNGYVIAQQVKFKPNDTTTHQLIHMTDKRVLVSKTDVTTSKEIAGATLVVKDEKGQIKDQWISTSAPHYMSHLEEGKTYTLSETIAPNGYVKANTITFKVSFDKKDEKVVMEDKRVLISKQDVTTSKELPGASLTIKDEKGNVKDKWTSSTSPHYVSNLEEDKTYILEEVTAPKGYVKAEAIKFKVTADKKEQKVVMKDKQVTVSKQDVTTSKEIPGASLTIKDEKGNIKDKWTSASTPHYVSNLEEGKTYILEEVVAPKNYVKAESIKFKVTTDKSVQKVVMLDKQVAISKQDVTTSKEIEGATLKVLDEKGKEKDKWVSSLKPHYVSHLEEGKTYTLIEELAPSDYVKAEQIQFTVSKDKKEQKVIMFDKHVYVSKQDVTTCKEIPGASLVVKDEKGEVKDEWISTNEVHAIKNLEEGKTYTLTEVLSPAHYALAETIQFTVSKDKEDSKVVMKDELTTIEVIKSDEDGKNLSGASLEIVDENGNVIESWISDDHAHIVRGLTLGEKYILVETKAPEGYEVSKSMNFTMNEKLILEMTDIKKPLAPIEKKVTPLSKKVVKTSDFNCDDYYIVMMFIGILGYSILKSIKA